MRLLFIALGLLFAGPVVAQEAPVDGLPCMRVAEVGRALSAKLREAHAEGTVLVGPDADAFLAVVNAEPPVTDVKQHEGVLLFEFPQGGAIAFVLAGEMICGPLGLNPEILAKAKMALSKV